MIAGAGQSRNPTVRCFREAPLTEALQVLPDGTMVKNLLANAKHAGDRPLVRGDLLEKERAAHSSILALKVPRTEEPGD